MQFEIDKAANDRLEVIRERGRKEARPIGLEADRLGRPIPVDDPYFAMLIERGDGRTRWRGPDADKKKRSEGESKKKRARGPSQATVMTLLFVEELAYWDRGVMVANPGVGLPEGNVLAMGTDEQNERFLGPFLKPDRPRWACFAMTEPGAGSDAAAIQTSARKDGDAWILNGAKCFIGNASRSDWLLVQATLDPTKGRAAQRAFFVEQGAPGLGGFRIEKKMGLKAYESTSFTLQDCRVPLDNLLGGEARYEKAAGFKSAMKVFNAGRPIVAANAVGIGRAALDEALDFAREHELLGSERTRDRLAALPAGGLVGRSAEAQHRRGLHVEGDRGRGGARGHEPGDGDARHRRRSRRPPDRKALPRHQGHGHGRGHRADAAHHHGAPTGRPAPRLISPQQRTKGRE